MKMLLLTITLLLSCPDFIHADDTSEQTSQNETAYPEQPGDLQELEILEQDNIDTIAKDIGIIRFTITLYKDRDNHDALEWQKIITKAAQSMYRLQNENSYRNDILKELNEIVDAVQNSEFDPGISGELTVEASDGQPMKNCCGVNCTCAERYRGNCPCSLNENTQRCFFPQETPFDDQYEEENNDDNSDNDAQESFEEVDLDSNRD